MNGTEIEITHFVDPDPGRGRLGRWEGTLPMSPAVWEAFEAGKPLDVIFQRKGRRYRGSAIVVEATPGAELAHVRGTGSPQEIV